MTPAQQAVFVLLPLALAQAQQPPAQPVGAWTFDDGDGTADGSGHGHTAVLAGATLVPGQGGRAAHFDGAAAHVDLPPASDYTFASRDTFTVDLWLRTTRQDFCTPLMCRHGGDVSFSLILGREPGRISWELWSWGNVRLVSSATVADGEWHRVWGVHDAATGLAWLLVDGQVEAVMPAGAGGPQAPAELRLGNNLGTHQPFAGELDEVTVYRGIPAVVGEAMAEYQRYLVLDDARLRAMQQAWLTHHEGPRNPQAASVAAWEARRRVVRQHTFESLGLTPQPARLPLDIRWGGKLQRDGYSLQRLYWQTWPGYYAAGYLYLPDARNGRLPAVLNPHGHWENGNRNPVVQARMISLARKGYVALTVDSVHAYDYYAGVSPLTVMTWNNIRALDLLCDLPYVDSARIGCTGCSGGAQQTFYLMALEDRLAAAVPVCMVCEYRRILAIEEAHCACNHTPGIAAETDQTELAACLAPKPSLFICVTKDWTRWFPQEGYPQIRSILGLYGQTDHTGVYQHEWGHDYSQPMREQMYGWFNRWLKGVDDPAQAKEAPFVPESLATLAALDQPPAAAAGLEAVYHERRVTRAAAAFDTSSAAGVRASAERVRRQVAQLYRQAPPVSPPAAIEVDRTGLPSSEGLTLVNYRVQTESDVEVPVVLLLPLGVPGRLPAAVVVNPAGKAQLLSRQLEVLAPLCRRGIVLALLDPRFYGEWSARGATQKLNGLLLGQPEAAVAAHDVAATARWLRSRADVDPRRTVAVGLGEAGAVALLAGALDPSLAGVGATLAGPTYADGHTAPDAPHLVTAGDLPELAAACVPRPVWLGGTGRDALWAVVPRAYAAAGAATPPHLQPRLGDLAACVSDLCQMRAID